MIERDFRPWLIRGGYPASGGIGKLGDETCVTSRFFAVASPPENAGATARNLHRMAHEGRRGLVAAKAHDVGIGTSRSIRGERDPPPVG